MFLYLLHIRLTLSLDGFNLHHPPLSSRDSKSLKCRKYQILGFITTSYNISWTGRTTGPMNVHGSPPNSSNMLRRPLLVSIPATLIGLLPKIYRPAHEVLRYHFLPSYQSPISRQLDLAELDLWRGTYCHGCTVWVIVRHVIRVIACDCLFVILF